MNSFKLLSLSLLVLLANINFGPANADSGCVFNKYQVAGLLVVDNNKNLVGCPYNFRAADIKRGAKLIYQYWDVHRDNNYRYSLLTKRYREMLARVYAIKTSADYYVPMFEPEKHWLGYMIERIEMVSGSQIEFSLITPWAQEGYEGVSTYIFSLKKNSDSMWEVDNIHY